MAKRDKATLEATPEVEVEVVEAPETSVAEEPLDEDAQDSAQLDEIFEEAIEAADLEKGDDKTELSVVSESAPAEDADVPKVEPSDTQEEVVEETKVEPASDATVEAQTKEIPAVEQPTVEPPTPIDSAKVVADYEKWRGSAEELLAAQHYKLTEDQAEEFNTDPGSAIPKLAAKLHMEVMQQSVAMMARLLPQVMANVSQAQSQDALREKIFFEKWPELVEHRDQVVRLGAVYWQMNPQATQDEFTRDVGAQVAVSMQVDLSGRQPKPVETVKAPVHTPISAGGGAVIAPPNAKLGVFEELFSDGEALDQQ